MKVLQFVKRNNKEIKLIRNDIEIYLEPDMVTTLIDNIIDDNEQLVVFDDGSVKATSVNGFNDIGKKLSETIFKCSQKYWDLINNVNGLS